MRWVALCVVVLSSSVAVAQPGPKPKPIVTPPAGKPKDQTIDIKDGLSARGKVRNANVLYFLERASEELERASLEKRSFLPKMTRALEEATL
jgi:hypothetical protein